MTSPAAKSWPSRSRSARVRCVIVESGSNLLAETLAGGFDETIAVTQTQDEPPLAFVRRAMARVEFIERSGKRFESAMLLTGDSHDHAAKAARRLLVLGVAAKAGAYSALSELTLVADGDAASETRTEMLELAEEVTASPNAEIVPVRVRFGAPTLAVRERPSGIFPAISSHS